MNCKVQRQGTRKSTTTLRGFWYVDNAHMWVTTQCNIFQVALALVMALLLVLLTYVVASHNNAGLSNAKNTPGFPFLSFLWSRSGISNLSKQEFIPNRFNLHLHLPSHFTIPILSPWSSVVSTPQSFHHEVSCPHRLYLLFAPFLYRWKIRPQAPSVLQPPPVSTPFS